MSSGSGAKFEFNGRMFKIFFNFNSRQSEIIVSAAWTLRELRIFIAKELSVEDDIRLVKAGKILSMDDCTLESLDIKENDVIFVAKLSSNNATAQASQQSSRDVMPDLGLDNPFLQTMLNSPEIMSSILEADPRFSEMAEKNPEIRSVMRDPSFIKQTLETLRNPVTRKELMRNQDRQLSNIEALPGGFNYLSSMFNDLKDPLSDSPDPSTEEANKRLAHALGAANTDRQGPNLNPLPNPWNRENNSNLGNSGFSRAGGHQDVFGLGPSYNVNSSFTPNFTNGFMPLPFQSVPASNTQTLSQDTISNLESKYSNQLVMMDGMGFTEKEKNLRALLAAGGNVEAAISYLLDHQ